MEILIRFLKTHDDAKLPEKNHQNVVLSWDEYQKKLGECENGCSCGCAHGLHTTFGRSSISFTTTSDGKSETKVQIPGTCDSGYDIFACADVVIPARGSAIAPTGIQVAFITPGYWFKIEARSGLSFKHGILPHPGIIDNPYRGDTGVKLYNHSDKDYQVKKGDRIAQLVPYEVIEARIEWTKNVSESHRGEKGFGASGR